MVLDKEAIELGDVDGRGTYSRRDLDRTRALVELSARLAESISDVDDVLQRVVQIVGSFINDATVIRLLDNEGKKMRVAAVYDRDARVRQLVLEAFGSIPSELTGLVPHGVVVERAEAMPLVGVGFTDVLDTLPEQARTKLLEAGMHTALICPLRVGGRVIGTLGLWRRSDRGAHSARDRAFAQELADRAALAIANARLVERLRTEVSERKENEENLRLTAELLSRVDERRRALMEHLVSAQEEERRRIAVDVHDDSIQAMAAIGVRLQIMRLRASTPELAEQIAAIEETVTETIGRLRALLFRLESASIEQVGLVRAITRFAGELFPDGMPRVRVTSRTDTEFDGATQIVLYRITQEALNNVLKHAEASKVAIAINESDGGVELSVHDDGVGFDLDDVARHALPGHLGMRAMRERAEVAGGHLEVESRPRRGTNIKVWLPTLDSRIAERLDDEVAG